MTRRSDFAFSADQARAVAALEIQIPFSIPYRASQVETTPIKGG
jgi:hypothetical protein